MNGPFDYWGLLAGIALFLFAMAQIETGLKALSGRSMARLLKVHAGSRLKSVAGGIVGTAILQSSSVVGLMVLAFTGAGLLNLTSALGIVFGSNLGTTLTGWIVATLGFKLDIVDLGLPLIGLGGMAYLFGRQRIIEYGRTCLGLGLLLLGLQMMKSSVESVEQLIDINDLAGLALWQYLLFGTVVAAVIQSSSATMIITLAALNAGIISLPNAAAVAIGADLGTTTTVMLGALRGSRTKQQVAAGHVLFNVVTDVIAFALLMPLLGIIAWLGVADPLYSLVAFHSLFNLIGLILFLPFTAQFARQLETLLPKQDTHEAQYLGEVSRGVGEAAIEAVERETAVLIARALRLIRIAFEPPLEVPEDDLRILHGERIAAAPQRPFEELYTATKTLEGELVEFTIRLQAGTLDSEDSQRLSQLLSAAREAVHSAKAIKNIRHNLLALEQSYDRLPDQYVARFRETGGALLADIFSLGSKTDATVTFEELAELRKAVQRRHDDLHNALYAGVRDDVISETDVSSLLNMNRELLTSSHTLIFALGDYYLDSNRSDDLERIPL